MDLCSLSHGQGTATITSFPHHQQHTCPAYLCIHWLLGFSVVTSEMWKKLEPPKSCDEN